ncbi:leucine Rich Repeat family protein [Thecamonas trahens ATCC 50062]|uniref:Leucine Rich Repeat family protein n=1 Tax=Thecamonas trahens ATCC 50062 TaxID=461836 RepID=A0A0L0D5N2_THETB|nr:leucine Rich Repeat family protein [Thecamonas trahens ATCC 50062]KNC46608.1 leucine Rich Repeat family protein [Thecamonas trahens ATCC 50062]|eukprot:XP_013760381.1 leucine Rich Repeat family protein [Thecamonas trahens ATCC 50062]
MVPLTIAITSYHANTFVRKPQAVRDVALFDVSVPDPPYAISGKPLKWFAHLTSLLLVNVRLSQASVSDLGFDSLPHLRKLWLAETSISSLPRRLFRECTVLEELYLYGNRLEAFDAISDVASSLTVLSLADNALTSLDTLPILPVVRNLAHTLPRVVRLNLAGNNWRSLPCILPLTALARSLRSLAFDNADSGPNPFCAAPLYDVFLLYHLPRLAKLDGRTVGDSASRVGPSPIDVAENVFAGRAVYASARIAARAAANAAFRAAVDNAVAIASAALAKLHADAGLIATLAHYRPSVRALADSSALAESALTFAKTAAIELAAAADARHAVLAAQLELAAGLDLLPVETAGAVVPGACVLSSSVEAALPLAAHALAVSCPTSSPTPLTPRYMFWLGSTEPAGVLRAIRNGLDSWSQGEHQFASQLSALEPERLAAAHVVLICKVYLDQTDSAAAATGGLGCKLGLDPRRAKPAFVIALGPRALPFTGTALDADPRLVAAVAADFALAKAPCLAPLASMTSSVRAVLTAAFPPEQTSPSEALALALALADASSSPALAAGPIEAVVPSLAALLVPPLTKDGASLVRLALVHCGLTSLDGLTPDLVPAVTSLDVTGNALRSLDDGLAALLPQLVELRVGHNRLDGATPTPRGAHTLLRKLRKTGSRLQLISLAFNPLCRHWPSHARYRAAVLARLGPHLRELDGTGVGPGERKAAKVSVAGLDDAAALAAGGFVPTNAHFSAWPCFVHHPQSRLGQRSAPDNTPPVGLLLSGRAPLTSLNSVAACTSLRMLDLRDNGLVSLAGLEALAQLESAVVAGNKLTDLDGLLQCQALRSLDASRNELGNAALLELPHTCRKLRVLDLSHNHISSLTPLADATALRELYLFHNSVAQLDEIDVLVGLAHLYSLGLAGNPLVTDAPRYRALTLYRCKHVRMLDGEAASSSTRVDTAKLGPAGRRLAAGRRASGRAASAPSLRS